MKYAITTWLLVGALCGLVACKSTLQPGGAYAPTDTNGVPTLQADYAFFITDSAYDLAYSSIDAVFKFERDNRGMLWAIDKNIKHTLDKARPQAVAINDQYLNARAVYLANRVPANLNAMQQALARAQQIATTLTAVLPKYP
jgi:hypothetical protein